MAVDGWEMKSMKDEAGVGKNAFWSQMKDAILEGSYRRMDAQLLPLTSLTTNGG